MMKLFGKSSFFDQEKKKLENAIRLPLLELVLEYLPHLHESVQEQDDVWELIAIKLNNHQFIETIGKNQNVDEKEAQEGFYSIDELPLLNGQFVKESFERIMGAFIDGVPRFNWRNKIYRTRIILPQEGHQDAATYHAFNFPVKEAYSDREDLICTELFYMKSLGVETKARISRERLIRKYLSPEAVSENIKQELHDEKQGLDGVKLEACLKELKKKDQKIEALDRENKRLMELNQTLLDELNLKSVH